MRHAPPKSWLRQETRPTAGNGAGCTGHGAQLGQMGPELCPQEPYLTGPYRGNREGEEERARQLHAGSTAIRPRKRYGGQRGKSERKWRVRSSANQKEGGGENPPTTGVAANPRWLCAAVSGRHFVGGRWRRAERGGGTAAAEDKQPWLAMTRDLNTSSLDFRSTSIPIPSQAGGTM